MFFQRSFEMHYSHIFVYFIIIIHNKFTEERFLIRKALGTKI